MANANAQDEYYPIHIARSDGQGYAGLDHRALKPDDDEDMKQLERWEVIIAGHLSYQLAPKDDKRQYKLAGFPKGYELRCAVREVNKNRDYYLYGHPAGPKANYRTPGDFVLHLMWLASDSADHAQCSCDLCIKMIEANKQRLPQGTAIKAPAPTLVATSAPAPNPQAPPANATPKATQPPPVQRASPPVGPPPGTTGLSNVFRVGELVWYKHQAWRLGLILATNPKGSNLALGDNNYSFVLAPLGHACLNLQNVTKDAGDMRPFLTFSVPNVSIKEIETKSYEEVDWPDFAMRSSQDPDPGKRAMRMQMVGLEASKMAARLINDSLSMFNKIGEGLTADGNYRIQQYTGVYLGAEMIRVGDPIRVTATGSNVEGAPQEQTPVMLAAETQLVTPAWSGDASAPPPSLQFKGNLYRIIRAPLPHPPTVVPAGTLGPTFEEEVGARNQIEQDKSMRWGWVLVERDAVRPEAEVLGRFYVTHKLMGIIAPERLQEAIQRGVVEEAQAYLNNRSHSSSGSGWGGRSVGPKPGRAATVGQAVSAQFVAPPGMVEG